MKKRSGGITAQSMAKGFAVLSAASIAVKVLSLLFVPVIRKLMGGSAGYQVYTSANQIYAFVYVIATAGLPVAISKTVTEFMSMGNPAAARRSFRLARTVLAAIGIVLTAVLVLLAKPIARASGYSEAWLGIAVIAPNILICSVLSAYRGYLQGLKNMTPTATSQIVEQIVHLLVAIAAVFILRGKGLAWAVAGASFGTVAGSVAALGIVIYYYTRSALPTPAPERTAARDGTAAVQQYDTKYYLKLLAKYSIPITLSAAIQYGGTIIDVFIVKSRLLHAGFAENEAAAMHGDLSAARQLINVPTALVTALCVSVLPIIAGLYAERRVAEAKQKAQDSFRLCFLAAVPCSIALMVYAVQIYGVLDFDRPFIMTAMAMSVLFMGVVHLQSSIMQSVNLLYQSTFFVGVGVLLKALLNYILIGIPALNIYGAVISTYVSYLVPMVMNAFALRKIKGINIRLLDPMVRPVIASTAMLLPSFPAYFLLKRLLSFTGAYVSNLIAFGIAAVIAVVVYFVVLRFIGGLKKEDVESISPRLARKLKLKDD
ncbi:MAG: polysaccharide biosynthesis protein [Clostridia bacterium]|nr:polysaccharide biosynthesis protein [Clostridia bacterium]